MSSKSLPLEQIRSGINEIDSKIIELLSKRRDLAKQVAYYKIENNKPVKDFKRENELLAKLVLQAQEKSLNLSADLINTVFKSIIEDSCNYQQQIIIEQNNLYKLTQTPVLKVAYLGLPGSYSYFASNKFAGLLNKEIETSSCSNFREVLDAVTSNQAGFGVLPIENTNSGSINEVYDLLSKSQLKIVADLTLDINHVLCAKSELTTQQIEVIYTHSQPYEQSIITIKELFPNARIVFTESTTHAIKACKESDNPKAVAIANQQACELYGLVQISDNIANNKNNQTKFVIVANSELCEAAFNETVSYKTMLLLITRNESGALSDALTTIKNYNINLTKLQSRPLVGMP